MGRRPLCLAALLFVFWILCTQVGNLEEKGGGLEARLTESGESRRIRVRGEVYRQEKKKTNQIYLKNNSILSKGNQESFDSNIIIFLKEEISLKIGNIVEVSGEWKEPERAGNPGQFDMEKWYQSQKIGMLMMKCRIALLDGKCSFWMQLIVDIRERLRESLYGIAEPKEASLICAMLLGDKNDLDEEVEKLYQDGGISHILAISGLHISMLGMLLFGLLRKLGLSMGAGGAIAGGVMGIYCMMTGLGVPAVRAFVMFLVYLGAQVFGRTYDLKNSLSLAVILILFQNPQLLFQGGFQLSVLAVAGLAYLYPVLKKRVKIKGKAADGLLISMSVQLMIFPCILYHFYQFSWTGIFVNLLVLPLMSVLLLAGLAGSALGIFVPAAGILVFAPCHYILWFVERLCRLSLEIPGAEQIWGKPEAVSIFLYYGILVLVFAALQRRDKSKKIFGAVLYGCSLSAAVFGLSVHDRKGLEMVFLDVGQGDSIFWRADGKNFLCDAGSSGVEQVGKYRIIPFLKCQGISKLDYLFLSHMDGDHVNGAEEILEGDTGISVGCLVMPEIVKQDGRYCSVIAAAEKRGIPVVRFHEGMEIDTGKSRLECLAPREGARGEDKNADSLVLAVQYGEFRALLTGDVEGEGEERLIESGRAGKVSVLKAAHHGSKNSTPDCFLRQTRPIVSIVSCGRENPYGHPSPELLQRLEAAGSVVYKTMENGAVTVASEGKGFEVRCFWDNF